MATADIPCLGRFLYPEAVDLESGPRQVSGLQRFSSGGETSPRREPHRQPRIRSPHLADAKLAAPQKRRPRQYRSRRPPRPRFGMMALTDASRHDWLEGRAPELTLIGFQDDATSKILAAHFQLEAENTLGYFPGLYTMSTSPGISSF